MRANFCRKFYTAVKNIHFATNFHLIISENDKIMLFDQETSPLFLSISVYAEMAASKNLHALLTYQQKSQGVTFYVHPVQ